MARTGRPPERHGKLDERKSGRTVRRTTIAFPPGDWARLRAAADREGRLVSWLVVTAVRRYLDELEGK